MSHSLHCTHCGEITNYLQYQIDDFIFCCHGCQLVFQFLNDSGLEKYYQLENNPGSRLQKSHSPKDYSYLDDPELLDSIHEFYSENLAKITLSIPSIHCSSCVWLLEKLPSLLNGVQSSRCNLFQSELLINYNPKIVSFSQIIAQIFQLGYETDLSLKNSKQNKEDTKNNELL
ncbi:heavy metal translocating P-type ATPase metal-binding domain-containing protein, partial [bacterium]|nr:heavy metal translocating P-type ATPase metal-binding domain-containing protein [bacterium]